MPTSIPSRPSSSGARCFRAPAGTCCGCWPKTAGDWHVAYCPERIAQGYAIRELDELPQIVSGCSDEAVERATELFALIAPQIIRLEVEEAELAKLFTNAWRYIQFAAANQFYMIAQSIGVDFNRVRQAMVDGYGRAASLPSAGFAAGPCLLKDTMQLAAFNANGFSLGHAAMGINEGLPSFLVESLKQRHKLDETQVGILGMAFKADIDDIRDSLSYKLGKVLRFHGADVFCTPTSSRKIRRSSPRNSSWRSDVVIVGVPHTPTARCCSGAWSRRSVGVSSDSLRSRATSLPAAVRDLLYRARRAAAGLD